MAPRSRSGVHHGPMPMRSIWNGSLSFGLVTIPVKLYGATEDHDIAFHQVHAADGGRIRYQRICDVCGEKVEFRDIAKAYDTDDGETVVSSPTRDFATLPADRSPGDLRAGVRPRRPDRPTAVRQVLLRRAGARGGQGVCVAAPHVGEHRPGRGGPLRICGSAGPSSPPSGCIGDPTRGAGDALAERRDPHGMQVPETVSSATVTDRELTMASTLVDSYSTDFSPEEFTDDYQVQMRALIESKLEGGQAFSTEDTADEGEDAEVLDLLAALERSVARRDKGESGSADHDDDADAGTVPAKSSRSRSKSSGGANKGPATRSRSASGTKTATRSAAASRKAAASTSDDDASSDDEKATGTEHPARTTSKARRRA